MRNLSFSNHRRHWMIQIITACPVLWLGYFSIQPVVVQKPVIFEDSWKVIQFPLEEFFIFFLLHVHYVNVLIIILACELFDHIATKVPITSTPELNWLPLKFFIGKYWGVLEVRYDESEPRPMLTL